MEGTLPLKEKAACATYRTKQQEIETTMLPLGKAQILQCFMFVPYNSLHMIWFKRKKKKLRVPTNTTIYMLLP